MKLRYYYFLFILCFISIIILIPNYSFGAYPKLISTISNAFQTIESWIIKLSTPAAAVAVRHRSFYEEV